MKCDRCGESMGDREEMELRGQTLCEDCYIDTLSPAKACDPWAVYSAKSLSSDGSAGTAVTEIQARILQILEETGGIEPAALSERLQMKPSDLEREVATLRHMEKLRGELRERKKFIIPW